MVDELYKLVLLLGALVTLLLGVADFMGGSRDRGHDEHRPTCCYSYDPCHRC